MPNTKYGEATKKELAASLKKHMKQKPLDKISIRELTEDCGYGRQTFYYHFEDIYDLMRWTFQQEAIALLAEHEGVLIWQDGLLQLFRYLEENRQVYVCALKSVGHEHIKRFLYADVNSIVSSAIEYLGKEVFANGKAPENDSYLAFLSHFYTVAFAGVVESWLLGEIDHTPEEVIDMVDRVLSDQLRGAMAHVSK